MLDTVMEREETTTISLVIPTGLRRVVESQAKKEKLTMSQMLRVGLCEKFGYKSKAC